MIARRLAAEALGSAFLLAAIIGSGIMGERLCGGNVAIALLANTLATAAALVVLKLGTGLITGSLALVSAGIESSGDVVAALSRAGRRFGLGRSGAACVEILRNASRRFRLLRYRHATSSENARPRQPFPRAGESESCAGPA